jgi:hypothetical protein
MIESINAAIAVPAAMQQVYREAMFCVQAMAGFVAVRGPERGRPSMLTAIAREGE